MTAILVMFAGGLGAVSRYLIGLRANDQHAAIWFVNLIGSVALGVLLGTEHASVFVAAGFLGGFTTFSTAAVQAAELAESGKFLRSQAHAWLMALACVMAAVLAHTAAITML